MIILRINKLSCFLNPLYVSHSDLGPKRWTWNSKFRQYANLFIFWLVLGGGGRSSLVMNDRGHSFLWYPDKTLSGIVWTWPKPRYHLPKCEVFLGFDVIVSVKYEREKSKEKFCLQGFSRRPASVRSYSVLKCCREWKITIENKSTF